MSWSGHGMRREGWHVCKTAINMTVDVWKDGETGASDTDSDSDDFR